MNRTYRKPFPDWMTRNDPFTANWQDNGFFIAFEERRQRREGWLGQKLPTLYPRVQSPLFIAIPTIIAYHFFLTGHPLLGGVIALCYTCFWIYCVIPRPSPHRLPYLTSTIFFPKLKKNKTDCLITVPDSEGRLGEALILDYIQLIWQTVFIFYGVVIYSGTCLLFHYIDHRYIMTGPNMMAIPIVLCILTCGCMLYPILLTKANEILSEVTIKRLRPQELKGVFHTITHRIYEETYPGMMLYFYTLLFAFQLFSLVGLIVFSLEWIIDIFITDPHRQLVTLQQLLCIVFLIPPLFFRKIRSWSMRTGKEKAIQARLRIKQQLERIL